MTISFTVAKRLLEEADEKYYQLKGELDELTGNISGARPTLTVNSVAEILVELNRISVAYANVKEKISQLDKLTVTPQQAEELREYALIFGFKLEE